MSSGSGSAGAFCHSIRAGIRSHLRRRALDYADGAACKGVLAHKTGWRRQAASTFGSGCLSPPALDLGNEFFQSQVVEPFPALGRVVTGACPKLAQEAERVHDPQVASQNLSRPAV